MKKYLIFGVSILIIFFTGAVIIMPNDSNKVIDLDVQTFSKEAMSKDYILLDIRTIDEFNAGHIKGAKEIDYYKTQHFSDFLDSLDKNKKYLIYCHSGRRSGLALEIFKQKGFKNVSDLAGGYNSWLASGLSIEK